MAGKASREGFSGRGSALLEVLDINGKGFLFATQGSKVAFLYLPLLIPAQWNNNVKETCNRNISRKAQSKQLQSNLRRGICLLNRHQVGKLYALGKTTVK